jgi:SAM-dependent methyltransferase
MKAKPKFLGPGYGSQFEDAAVAEVYRKRPPYPPETFEYLDHLLPVENRGLLDLGAGTGEISIPMARRAEFVHSVEPSSAMIEVARSLPGSLESNITWFNSSGEAFDYPRKYGLVVCAQCLGWMDWEVVFPKIAASLDVNGWLVIIAQTEISDRAWTDALRKLIARYSTNQDYVVFDLIPEIAERGLFEKTGSRRTPPLIFEQSIGDFIDSIHARNGFSRDRMSADSAEAFDLEVRKLLQRHHPSGVLHGEVTATVTWGRPVTASHQT